MLVDIIVVEKPEATMIFKAHNGHEGDKLGSIIYMAHFLKLIYHREVLRVDDINTFFQD